MEMSDSRELPDAVLNVPVRPAFQLPTSWTDHDAEFDAG
jgi:hypothetical protein